jgi:hypothetical protein
MPAKDTKLLTWGPDVDALLVAARDALPPRSNGKPWPASAVVRMALAIVPEASQRAREKAARDETGRE